RASSVSRAMLGQIELAKSVPSIVVLWKIARALGVPISEILTGDTVPTARVLRRGESRSVTSLGGGLVARSLLSDVDSRRCAFYELSLAAHATEPASAQERGTRVNLVV